jgi:Tfp pilus assembly protein PilN
MRIDFAAPGWRRALYRSHPAVLAGCALGLALCAGAAAYGYQMAQQQRARAEQLGELERQQRRQAQQLQQQKQQPRLGQQGAAPAAKVQMPEAQSKAINAAVLQLNLPWRDMQEAVGEATPASIALLALEPDPNKQVLKISAEAKNPDDMIAYIEQLKQQEFFVSAALVRHEINDLDPNRPVRFQVEAQWGAR